MRAEAWTMPTSVTFERKLTLDLAGGSGSRILSGWSDNTVAVPATISDPNPVNPSGISDLELIAATAPWIRAYSDDGSLADEFRALRFATPLERPSTVEISGPQRNGLAEGLGVWPFDWPRAPSRIWDWVWEGDNLAGPLELGDLDSIREQWELYLSGERYTLEITATGGTFTLTAGGNTTTPIDFDTTEGGIRSALEGLTGIEIVSVRLSDDETEFTIVFEDPKDLASDMTIDTSGLTGGSATLTKLNNGFNTATDPTFTITIDGETTEALDWDADPDQLEGSPHTGLGVQGLPSINDALVTGSGTLEDPWVFTFYDPPTISTFTVTFAAGTAVLERTVDGALDPSPITVSQFADERQDPKLHGTYGEPALEVITDPAHQDGDTDWVLKVNATGRFGGSQRVLAVTPGAIYQASIRVKPTVSGEYTLVIRDLFENFITNTTPRHIPLTAGVYGDLSIVDVQIPEGVDHIIMRAAIVDADPATWATHYVNWQEARFVEGMAPATPGKIVRQLVEAAQSRGTFNFLELGFTDTLDSDGTAWPTELSFAAFVRSDLGHVLGDLHDLSPDGNDGEGYEWEINAKAVPTTKTHVLDLWVPGGGGTGIGEWPGSPPSLVAGSAPDFDLVRRTPRFTVGLAQGLGGLFTEQTDAALIANIGRWESSFDVEHLGNAASIAEYLAGRFAAQESNQKAASATVLATDSAVPLVHYGPGDEVYWMFPPLLTREPRRVRRINWVVGEPDRFTVQGSKVLSGDGAIAEAVERFLREVKRRRRPKPVQPLNLGGGATIPDVVIAASDTVFKGGADLTADSIDAAEAILEAVGRLPDSGGWIHLMEGTYPIPFGVTFALGANQDLKLTGAAIGATRLICGTNGIVISCPSVNPAVAIVRDLTIDGDKAGAGTASSLLFLATATNLETHVENVEVIDGPNDGIFIDRSAGQHSFQAVIATGNSGNGLRSDGEGDTRHFDCRYSSNGAHGIQTLGGTHQLTACRLEQNVQEGVDTEGLTGGGIFLIGQSVIDGNGGDAGLDLLGDAGDDNFAVIVGNQITNNTGRSVTCDPNAVVAANYINGNGINEPSVNSGGNVIGDVPAVSQVPQTITFSHEGTAIVGQGQSKWVADSGGEIVSVRAAAGGAPTGHEITVDLNLNDATVFTLQTDQPTVPAGSEVGTAVPPTATSTFVAGDFLTADIDEVGTTIPGADVTVIVEIHYTET